MSSSKAFQIRDYIFRETVSCPLKLSFLLREKFDDQREDLFRRKTKRMLREAVAQQFNNIQFTSEFTDEAAVETKKWLKKDRAAICGAVVSVDNVRARIPILIKEENQLTIFQLHGKVLKNNSANAFENSPLSISMNRYLLMAAYRFHVLELTYPGMEIFCKFMFPVKSYKAPIDHLYQKTQGIRNIDQQSLEELKNIFVTLDGTKAVQKVKENIPAEISHSTFSGLDVSDAIELIQKMSKESAVKVNSVHENCRDCDFRKSKYMGVPGCWDIHFHDDEVKNGDRHQFDLIGHKVDVNEKKHQIYQEKIPQTKTLSTASEIMRHSDKKIAIYHRKALQLIDARNQKVPLVFAKELLNQLIELEYPIHFLDFEAASHAVPLQLGKRVYEPVIFQFSCHTLYKNGELEHTQWLDQKPESEIHHELISALSDIPDFSKGTIVQYSPFEKQVLNKLYSEMRENKTENHREFNILEKFLQLNSGISRRFLDLSAIIHDGYYNRYMQNGLSLKQILFAVLKVESLLGTLNKTEFKVGEITVDLLKKNEYGNILDPYQQIADGRSRIQDGITAMHAYLCLKAGALSNEQKDLVPVLMKRYCTMDTLALYLIFSHLINLVNANDFTGDFVIEDDAIYYNDFKTKC